ncbi:hypothetical protein R3P38DRAFT_3512766 [Favolaschia claudopus]|uniref:Uncharacterized protein n=1 Tax=Favolaschia claudopus TaxID=2862362 RepID=A0AAW0BT18_9AGAR
MSGFVQETCVNTLDLQPIVSTTLNNDQLLLRANFKLSLLGHTTIGLAFLFFLPAFPVETSNAVPLRCRLRVTLRHLAAPSQCMYRIRIDGENHRQRVSQARMKCGPACRRIGGLGGKFSAYQASEEPELISLAAVHASFCDTCVLAISCYHATFMAKQCGPHGTTTRCGRDAMGILSVEQTASIRFRSSVPNDQVAKHGENGVIEFH